MGHVRNRGVCRASARPRCRSGRTAADGVPGYDSAGIAVLDGDGGLTVRRRAGRLANLEAALVETDPASLGGTAGIGHTRWATHGRPTDRNAHPHRDAAGKFAVVHNGIIENFAVLRAELESAGVEFASDTDTEVAVHLVAHAYQAGPTAGDFVASVLAVLRRLEGHFTLVFAHAEDPGTIVAARRSTPLVVGIGSDEMFLGSDVAAFIEFTRDAVELGQDQAVVITADGYQITDFDGNDDAANARLFHIDWDLSAAEKGGYEYFMLRGDRRAACRGFRHSAGSLRQRPDRARRAATLRPGTPRSRQGLHRGLRQRLPPGCWPSTRSNTGRGCPSRSRWPVNSDTGTRSWTAAPW